MMHTAFLSVDDERWATWVDEHACDIYQHPAYLWAAAVHEGGEPVAFFAQNDAGSILVPLLLRDIPGTDRQDATSPYGYPAPVWSAADPTPYLAAFFDALREREIVSAFLRLHPLLPGVGDLAAHAEPREPVASSRVEHGPTVWLHRGRTGPGDTQDGDTQDGDLHAGDLLERTRPDHRSDIRRLMREGYRVELHRPDALGVMDAFCDVYTATMDRVNASPFYYFSDEYFEAWTTALADHADLALVRDGSGEVAAAGLFTRYQRWMQFHLSGTADAHRTYAPTKLMLHRMRDAEWTATQRTGGADSTRREREPAILHLGGGLNAATDSLFDFKAGFSDRRALFFTWRIIADPSAYASLVRDHASSRQPPNGTARSGPPPNRDAASAGLSGGFFPAYRR
jgi:hypothetical protein